MPWLVLTVVLLAFILLTVASRSIVIATKAAVLKRVITTAGVIMIAVFTSFVLDPDPAVKILAIGMAAAVLIDASVIRMILVPAVMSLLGRNAWRMPRWLDCITPNLDIEGSEHLARASREEQAALTRTPTAQ